MKLHGNIRVNGKLYEKGAEVSWLVIYPFFLVHMLMFGGAGFAIAYKGLDTPVPFLYLHGGLAIIIYTVFYLMIFGRDEVKWMFVNGALGLFGIYSQIGWIVGLFGREIGEFPWYVHVIPVLYFVLYTFLIRQAILDITGSRDNDDKRRIVEFFYVAASLAIYMLA